MGTHSSKSKYLASEDVTKSNANQAEQNYSQKLQKTDNDNKTGSDTNKEAAAAASPDGGPLKFCEIMISYSRKDHEFAKFIKEKLEQMQLSVWIDLEQIGFGNQVYDKIGKAIIEAKVVIAVVSENQITSKVCASEIAMAYMQDKPIVVCALGSESHLLQEMPTGMKLQLSTMNWICFDADENNKREQIDADSTQKFLSTVITCLRVHPTLDDSKASLEKMRSIDDVLSGNESVESSLEPTKAADPVDKFPEQIIDKVDFWDEFFTDQTTVTWQDFQSEFRAYISKNYSKLFDTNSMRFLMPKLKKELISSPEDFTITHEKYQKFIEEYQCASFIKRFRTYASEMFTVRTVFDLESSVRLDAIDNLGKYKSRTVIEALLDLTNDDDADVRAVALLSLAKTNSSDAESERRIASCLKDRDRMVRECACLALGHMSSQTQPPSSDTIRQLVEVWRNDVIANVRSSAVIALQRFDTEEAKLAVRMTEILNQEISLFRE